MTNKERLEHRRSEIEKGLVLFFQEHLNEEYLGYAMNLLTKLARKRTYTFERGQINIWVAAIICVIARMNYLFDSDNEHYTPMETICNFCSTKKSTVGQKATEIEKACKIRMGDSDFCTPRISGSFTFYQLPNGMVITKDMAIQHGLLDEDA